MKAKFTRPVDDRRDAEAAKTSRLRALRLAKEATDKEMAAREAAANPGKSPKRRVQPASSANSSERV